MRLVDHSDVKRMLCIAPLKKYYDIIHIIAVSCFPRHTVVIYEDAQVEDFESCSILRGYLTTRHAVVCSFTVRALP